MMRQVTGFKIISYNGEQQTIIPDDGSRLSASEYNDKRLGKTLRQENFYHNLLQLHRLLNYSKNLPVYFTDDQGSLWRLDRGCVKMAVNSGFLEELKDNDGTGYLTEVCLTKAGLNWIKECK